MYMLKTGDHFLHALSLALRTNQWKLVRLDPLIRFENIKTRKKDCPLSVVAEFLTGRTCRSSFTMPELTSLGIAEWLIVCIAHAADKCDVGQSYGPRLRRRMERISRAYADPLIKRRLQKMLKRQLGVLTRSCQK